MNLSCDQISNRSLPFRDRQPQRRGHRHLGGLQASRGHGRLLDLDLLHREPLLIVVAPVAAAAIATVHLAVLIHKQHLLKITVFLLLLQNQSAAGSWPKTSFSSLLLLLPPLSQLTKAKQ